MFLKLNIENKNDWIKIERQSLTNMINIWSNEDSSTQTMDPWSSNKLWTFIMNFKYSDMNLKDEFVLIIQWCFCLLSIQAFNRDWDLSKLQINFEEYKKMTD